MSNFDAKESLRFVDGHNIPRFGLGTWKADKEEIQLALDAAIDIGYRHIDCAPIYENEKYIGDCLSSALKGKVNREELFITSKLWNSDHRAEHVREAFFRSLEDLKVGYLDLYLIHWPISWEYGVKFPKSSQVYAPNEIPIGETWRELEKLKKEGFVRSLGVSNFSKTNLSQLISDSEFQPVVNQIEFHPYLQQRDLLEYCRAKGVVVVGYAPLGSPVHQQSIGAKPLASDPTIVMIANKHATTPSDILLRWGISKGVALIPKSTKRQRLMANFQSMQKTLDLVDIEAIDSLECNQRFFDGSEWCSGGSLYKIEHLWGD